MGSVKDKNMIFFQNKHVYGGGNKQWKLKAQKQSEDKLSKNIGNFFRLKRRKSSNHIEIN